MQRVGALERCVMTSIILGILSAGPAAALAAAVFMMAVAMSFSARVASAADVDARRDREFRISHPPQVWAAP